MLLRAHDRKNMLIAEFTEMCLFTTEISFTNKDGDGKLIVTFNPPTFNEFSPAQTEKSCIEVPLEPDVSALALEKERVVMHSSPVVGYNMGPTYNDWFSERFGYEVILVYIGKSRREVLGSMPPKVAGRIRKARERDEQDEINGTNWWSATTSSLPSIPILNRGIVEDDDPGVDQGIAFADVAPYLVISSKSWENAQARLPKGEELDISKFRPNIIVEGAEKEFEEDYWGELDIFTHSTPSHGDEGSTIDGIRSPLSFRNGLTEEQQQRSQKAKLVLTLNCARCNSLNVDYHTGKVGTGEAGKILKRLQSDRRVDPGSKYSPIFGRYGFLSRLANNEARVTLTVGDEVEVARWNKFRTEWGE